MTRLGVAMLPVINEGRALVWNDDISGSSPPPASRCHCTGMLATKAAGPKGAWTSGASDIIQSSLGLNFA